MHHRAYCASGLCPCFIAGRVQLFEGYHITQDTRILVLSKSKTGCGSANSVTLLGRKKVSVAQSADGVAAGPGMVPGLGDDSSSDISCLAKIYDYDDGFLKLNDMIEIIGVYTVDPYLSVPSLAVEEYPGFDGFDDAIAASMTLPPSSVAPRVHCILLRRLGSSFPLIIDLSYLTKSMDSNDMEASSFELEGAESGQSSTLQLGVLPLNASAFDAPDAIGSANSLISQFTPALLSGIRCRFIKLIADIFGGDELVAEYLLLATLSHVYIRDEDQSLGHFSINVCGLSPNDDRVGRLNKLLGDLVPRTSMVRQVLHAHVTIVFLCFVLSLH
jgi:Mini-chromosome maintenance replisome factor